MIVGTLKLLQNPSYTHVTPNNWSRFGWTTIYVPIAMDIFILDSQVGIFFLTSNQPWAEYLGPKLHPRGRFLGPWFLIILKNSHQDLSNEGSNFILSSLEFGHWVAQTWPFFDKLSEITDFGLLEKSRNRTRFWIC